jgi:hypothetical protein
MILLLEEFTAMPPTEGTFEDWQADLTEMKEMLITCCSRVDPQSTEETLERAKELSVDEAI